MSGERVTSGTGCQARFEPTPEQIRAACREIQAEWSAAEERSRRVIPHSPARVPEVTVAVPS